MNLLAFLKIGLLLTLLFVPFGCGDSSPKLPLAGFKVEFGPAQHSGRDDSE